MGKLSTVNLRKDFVVAGYVVKGGKVLLIDHKKLGKWLPIGGHIEPKETPDQAMIREAKEEAGIDVEIIFERYSDDDPDVEMLSRPDHVQLERIVEKAGEEHQHIDFVYVCRVRGKGNKHRGSEECRWFSNKELEADPKVPNNVKFFAKRAIDRAESFVSR
jgi:8-oxo-dGTP pyrophosphatase MutT (NUDIX family)